MPDRFDLSFVDAGGERRRPVMLHCAIFGSLERFLGILLERQAGHIPPWLAPVQARVLLASQAAASWGEEVRSVLARGGVRVDADHRNETLARRVAIAHEEAVPFVIVIGEREAAARTLALRAEGRQRALALDEAIGAVVGACAPPA